MKAKRLQKGKSKDFYKNKDSSNYKLFRDSSNTEIDNNK